MANSSRNTGLEMLGDTPWGKHFSLFYETTDDLFEIVVPYLKAGLENNELCVWVVREPVSRLAALDPDERVALGCPPDDVIWVPAVDGGFPDR